MAKETDPYLMSKQELIARVIELEGKLFDIEEKSDPSIETNVVVLQLAFGLSDQQARFLLCLADGKIKSREFIREYAGIPRYRQVDVLLHTLRRRLLKHGVVIKSQWATGLYIGPGLTIVRTFLKNPQLVAA